LEIFVLSIKKKACDISSAQLSVTCRLMNTGIPYRSAMKVWRRVSCLETVSRPHFHVSALTESRHLYVTIVSWSLTSLFSTSMAISETKHLYVSSWLCLEFSCLVMSHVSWLCFDCLCQA